jgi:hypothetical protein
MAKNSSKKTSKPKSPAKTPARSMKASQMAGKSVPGGEQDVKRRLGNFTSAGEHARVGGRTSGIVGQTTKRNHTDQRKK